jgi:hypothetical protein
MPQRRPGDAPLPSLMTKCCEIGVAQPVAPRPALSPIGREHPGSEPLLVWSGFASKAPAFIRTPDKAHRRR